MEQRQNYGIDFLQHYFFDEQPFFFYENTKRNPAAMVLINCRIYV
jgi:hypothetical protein